MQPTLRALHFRIASVRRLGMGRSKNNVHEHIQGYAPEYKARRKTALLVPFDRISNPRLLTVIKTTTISPQGEYERLAAAPNKLNPANTRKLKTTVPCVALVSGRVQRGVSWDKKRERRATADAGSLRRSSESRRPEYRLLVGARTEISLSVPLNGWNVRERKRNDRFPAVELKSLRRTQSLVIASCSES